MFFETADTRIKKLEKRVGEMEKRVNKALAQVESALMTITDVVEKLGKEPGELVNERKRIQRQLSDSANARLAGMATLKESIKENIGLVKAAAMEGFGRSEEDLLALVKTEGETSARGAAEKLGVHDIQIEYWAKSLKGKDKIEIVSRGSKAYLKAR